MPHSAEPLPPDPADAAREVTASVDRFLEEHRHWDEPEWCLVKKDLARRLRRLEPRVAFEVLVRVVEHSEGLRHQRLVAELLRRMGRRCPLPREDVVHRVASNFNLSASHLPAYLAEQYGREAVLADLDALAATAADPTLAIRVHTLRWWLGGAG
jgi:hypothetical protein